MSPPGASAAAHGASPLLVRAQGLKKYFAIRGGIAGRTVGFVRAVDGVDLNIPRGKTLGLIGESGCGKTTVGRCLLHLLEPTSGEVVFDGRNLEVAERSRVLWVASVLLGLSVVFNLFLLMASGIAFSLPSGALVVYQALGSSSTLLTVFALVGVAGGVWSGAAVASRRDPRQAALGAVIVLGSGTLLLGGVALALVLVSWRKFEEDDLRSMRKNMQIVFQDPFGSLNPRMLVSRIVSEGLRAYRRELSDRYPAETAAGGGKLTEESMEKVVANLLARVGLNPEHLNRFPHEFSGGQRQRICVARALALKPSFIVLDEPTSALDVSVQAQILNLLKELQRERGLTYLFISHHLAVIRHMCDEVAVMYLGRIVEEASNEALFSAPTHPYTIALLSAIPSVDPQTRRERIVLYGEIPSPANPPTGCRFHTRCMLALEREVVEAPLTVSELDAKTYEISDALAAANTVRLVAGGKELDPLAAAGTVAYEVDDADGKGLVVTMHVDVDKGAPLVARYRRYRSECATLEPPLAPVEGGHRVACHFAGEVREAQTRADRERRPIGSVMAEMRAPLALPGR